MALVLFIGWRCEELCQLLYPGRPNALPRLLVNVLQSGLWVTAVLTESRGILCLHLFHWPLVTRTSSGIWGKWHACCWRRWDWPLLVLQLHGNLLQDGDPLLLFSQIAHLSPRHCVSLFLSHTSQQAVERALHLWWQFWWRWSRRTGWCWCCLWAWSVWRRLRAAFRWCLRRRRRTISATCTGARCAWVARWGTGQKTQKTR